MLARIEQITIAGFGNLTASIGIATFPMHAASRVDLFRAADDALYAAKRQGRNRVCLADNSVQNSNNGAARLRKDDPTQQTGDEVVM